MLNMISFSPHNHQMRVMLLLSPILQPKKGRLTDVAETGLEDFIPSQSLPLNTPALSLLAKITRRLTEWVSPARSPGRSKATMALCVETIKERSEKGY